jgi:hypothetical protein
MASRRSLRAQGQTRQSSHLDEGSYRYVGIDMTLPGKSFAPTITNLANGGRYYFNLTNGEVVIRDEEGTEVLSMESALISAMEMIEELRAEDPFSADEWQGWRLEIIDSSGRMVQSMPLDTHSLQ